MVSGSKLVKGTTDRYEKPVVSPDGSYVGRENLKIANDPDTGSPSTIQYVGYATHGTATSAAEWRILRITDSAGSLIVEHADGDIEFDNIYDNREALSYS